MWIERDKVDLDPKGRGPVGSDAWVWHWLTLALLVNRHVPDAFDDDLVSQELDRVWHEQKYRIPFYVE